MSEELVRKIYESIKDKWGGLANYIVVKNAVKRFCELNPTADPLTIDWASYYRPDFDYEELLKELKKAYPMYRWGFEQEVSEEQYFRELYSYLVEQARELPEELRLRLLRELQAEFGFEEVQKVGEVQQVQQVEVERLEEVQQVEVQRLEKPVISLMFLAKYPMLEETKKVIAGFKIDQIPEEAYERAYESILEAIRRGEVSTKLDNPIVEILSKPLMMVLTALMPSQWLKYRVALAEAIRMERNMYVDSDTVFNLFLERLNNLGIRIEKTEDYGDRHGEYRMYFVEYLKMAKPLLTEPRWKMVNRTIHQGYIYLNKAEVVRLIRAFYQQIILNKVMSVNPRDVPEKIKKYVEDIKLKVKEAIISIKGVVEEVRETKGIPPCIKIIIGKLKTGDEVSHFENFTVTAFLVNVGRSVEEVLELFKNRSDYNEKIARYQVEHIAGLKGSRTRYKPPSCDRLRSLGICYKNGEECPRSIKNPLQYKEAEGVETRQVS